MRSASSLNSSAGCAEMSRNLPSLYVSMVTLIVDNANRGTSDNPYSEVSSERKGVKREVLDDQRCEEQACRRRHEGIARRELPQVAFSRKAEPYKGDQGKHPELRQNVVVAAFLRLSWVGKNAAKYVAQRN